MGVVSEMGSEGRVCWTESSVEESFIGGACGGWCLRG